MLSPARTIYFLLNISILALLALIGTSPLLVVPALAAPVPAPTMYHDADFASKPSRNVSSLASRDVRPFENVVRDILDTAEQLGSIGSNLPRRELEARQDIVNNFVANMNLLTNYYHGMQNHASNFRE